MRVIGMERAGYYRRSTTPMWMGLVLLSMQFARQQYSTAANVRVQSAPGVGYKFSPTHRRCNDVCQQLWRTQRHSTASLEPRLRRPQLSSELRTAHSPIMASWTRSSHIARPRSGVEKIPPKARSEQLRKQAGGWAYSLETSALRRTTCRSTRSRFERRQNGNRMSKHSRCSACGAYYCAPLPNCRPRRTISAMHLAAT